MKLIDADSLEKEIYKWMPKDQETWMDSEIPPIENLVVSIMMTIEEQETIDAVPVEWLQAHITTIEQQRLLDEWVERKADEIN